jgi:phage tail sheath protein FI
MPFQISPGVNVSEIDLTTVIPAVSTSIGAFAGIFNWGPAEVTTLVSSEKDLEEQFGKPNSNTAVDFFTAANFLSYSNALRVVRVTDTTTKNAADDSRGAVLIKNDETFIASEPTANTFYAKYAGQLGNQLTVELCDTAGEYVAGHQHGFAAWWPNTYFSAAPETSPYASARGSANDELHIAIIDSPQGHFSGTANGVLELYPFLSKATDAKTDSGDANYFKTVINNKSKYIRIGSATAATQASYNEAAADATQFGNTATGIISTKLSGGVDGPAVGSWSAGKYQTAYDLFSDSDQEDVSLILAGEGGSCSDSDRITNINYVIDLATTRKDAVAFYSPLKSDTADQATATAMLQAIVGTSPTTGFRTYETNKNTSYAFMDSGWKYQYDKYNDVYRWIPLNGDIAGLAARTDNQRDAWWSFAGYNRGQIKNVVRLAFNPSKAQRDSLYKKQVNPVVTFPGQGTLLYGDKTSATRPSAFDRINVRRLFIVLEKAISTAAKFSLFEFNDDFTRAQFRNMVEPFLRDVKGRRGINDFKVVCDTTNNPGSVIDRNEFVGDIYIKPARSINFIQLNFVAVATGVDFSEIVGKF